MDSAFNDFLALLPALLFIGGLCGIIALNYALAAARHRGRSAPPPRPQVLVWTGDEQHPRRYFVTRTTAVLVARRCFADGYEADDDDALVDAAGGREVA